MFYKHPLEKLFEKVTLKKIVAGRGHDGGGLIADIYFGKKKIGTFHDDGWGGEPEIRIISDKYEAEVIKFFDDNNAQKLIEEDVNRGQFNFKVTCNTLHEQLEMVAHAYADHKEILKLRKKEQHRKFIVGEQKRYGIEWHLIGWNLPLEAVAMRKNGKKDLQKVYDENKEKIFLNEREELDRLGIVV